jgi:hypothetical protein
MRFSTSIFALVAPLLVSSAPARFTKRAAADITVFQFADVLEQLETQFYTQALAKFKAADFQAAGFTNTDLPIELFTSIQLDESNHTTVIEAELVALGGSSLTGCKFDFSSVLTDVSTMAATARVVENVGVAAYIGGSTLLTDPQLVAAAASILTIEARHQTILNIINLGDPIPAAFDIALTPSEVLAIAGGFISGCSLGIPANPALTVTNTGAITAGTQLTFKSPAINGSVSTDSLFCQMLVGGMPTAIPLAFNQCIVPAGINGPVAIFITTDGQPLANNVVERATTQLLAGPLMTFIDNAPSAFGQSIRTATSGSGSGSATTTASTQTITPEQAQSLMASASTAQATPAVDNAASPTPSTPGPNTATGPSNNGSVNVNGWTTVPATGSTGYR